VLFGVDGMWQNEKSVETRVRLLLARPILAGSQINYGQREESCSRDERAEKMRERSFQASDL
jgi:hypothetical protein